MLKPALVFISTLIAVAKAASLQNPIVTTAYYTSTYVGGSALVEINDINNNGLAVGELLMLSKAGPPLYGTTYRNGVFYPIYNVPNSMDGTRLTGINDNGTYVGYGAPQFSNAFSGFVGASQNPSAAPATLNYPGALSTYPYSINNAGTIVGGYSSSTDGLEHGFIYRPDGTFQTLDDLALQSTALVGINNHGQIVSTVAIPTNTGYPNPGPSRQVGFLYSGG